MIINVSKTKEKKWFICFCKDEHHVENVARMRIEDIPIERVSRTKVLGVCYLIPVINHGMLISTALLTRQVNLCTYCLS